MPSRRSVLATSSGALLASLSGCLIIESGGSDGDDAANARRWLTGEVARIPYDDPPAIGEAQEPLLSQCSVGRPTRAQSVEELSEYAMQRVGSHGDIVHIPIPTEQTEEITSLFGGDVEIAIGEFDAPEPPANATEAGTHRDATLYTVETPSGSPFLHGYAIADGICAFVSDQSSTEAVTASLESLLDTEAGEGTPIEADGEIDRIWSYLEPGFLERYYNEGGAHGGISLRADGDLVHRRSIVFQSSESEAQKLATHTEGQVANAGSEDGEDRGPYNFDPYDDVTVNRDGRVVTVEGSLPPSEVAYPEFVAP